MATRHSEGDQVEQLYSQKVCSLKNKYTEPEFAEEICEAIFMLIPRVNRLKELFLGWSTLPRRDRIMVDKKLQHPDLLYLYKPLREALIRYENIQDTQGAPGCDSGMVNFFGDPQLEEGLTTVIMKLEKLLIIASQHLEDLDSEDEDNEEEPDDDTSSTKTIKSSSNIRYCSSNIIGNANDVSHELSRSISLDNIHTYHCTW